MRARQPHPSSFDQLSPEFFGGIVEGELLTAQVVDGRVALYVKVVVETNLLWRLLREEKERDKGKDCFNFNDMSDTVLCLAAKHGSRYLNISQRTIKPPNE